MGFNFFCLCCDWVTSIVLGLCSSRYPWFAPLLCFLGQVWIYFGFALFFVSIWDITPVGGNEFGVRICKCLFFFSVSNYVARSIAEYISQFAERTMYLCAALFYSIAFFLMAYQDMSIYYVYIGVCPLLGIAVAFFDVSVRYVTADQKISNRYVFIVILYAMKIFGLILATLFAIYAMPSLNWKYSFYVFSGFSAGTLTYVFWFMPSGVSSSYHPLHECFQRSNKFKIIILFLADVLAGGLRWIMPLLFLRSMILEHAGSVLDLRFIFTTYVCASCVGGALRAIGAEYKWNFHILATLVSSLGGILVCFTYPIQTDITFQWNMAVFTGLLGFDVIGSDGMVLDLFGVAHHRNLMALLSLCSCFGAIVLFFIVCENDVEKFTLHSTEKDFHMAGYIHIIIAVLVLYLHLYLNQRRTFRLLSV